MKKILNIAFALIITTSVSAQELNSYYSYLLNKYNINPAYTGETEGIKTLLTPSTQWVGLDGSPSNSMFGIHSAIRDNMGLGGKIIMDKRGVFTNFSSELNYSYKVDLNDEHRLSFGVSAGLFQTYINTNTIIDDRYTDETDPVATTEYVNKSHFVSSFGVLYNYKGLEIGASSPHLVLSGRNVSDHIFGTAKYTYKLEDYKLNIIPSVVYQNLSTSPNQFDGGLMVEYDKTAWVQYVYRTNNTMVVAAGVNFNKFNFGYAYVINQSALSAISKGSHEVLIAFTFDKRNKKNKSNSSQKTSFNEKKSKYAKILEDLKEINLQDSASPEIKAEIKAIQEELSGILSREDNGSFSKEDQQKIDELETRIGSLKDKLKN